MGGSWSPGCVDPTAGPDGTKRKSPSIPGTEHRLLRRLASNPVAIPSNSSPVACSRENSRQAVLVRSLVFYEFKNLISLSEKLTNFSLVKKCTTFHETWWFIIAITRAWDNWMQSTFWQPNFAVNYYNNDNATQWYSHSNMQLPDPQKLKYFFIIWATISFSWKTLLHTLPRNRDILE